MAPSAQANGQAIMGDARGGTRWSIAGAVAGLMMVACMLVLRALTGVPALPELFQDQVIALFPGSLFGFVVGLASQGVPGGAVLGWFYGRAWLKLVEKTRNGPRVRRRYDTAQTPYRRLLALGNLAAATRHHLDARYAAVRPIHLKTALEEAQTELSAHATRSHSAGMQRMALGQVPL